MDRIPLPPPFAKGTTLRKGRKAFCWTCGGSGNDGALIGTPCRPSPVPWQPQCFGTWGYPPEDARAWPKHAEEWEVMG